MVRELRELWRFRELLVAMVDRELRIRYKNSFFGFFWSLLNPLITMTVMWAVFKFFLNNKTDSFSAYIFAAYLPYMFFQMALLDCSQSIISALPVIKKVYFPREILPLAAVLSNFIHFMLSLGVYFVFLLAVWLRHPQNSPFTITLVWVPVLIIIQLMLVTGLAFFVSALNTFYEDVKYMLGVGLYLLFFLSPIMYFSEQVRFSNSLKGAAADWVYVIYHLNPIAMLCTAYRKLMLAPVKPYVGDHQLPYLPMDWGLLGVTALVSLTLLVFGYNFFNSMKWKFVERP
ncbi:MAG: ABC transporter permease [Armatimonadetes bacterium]|nr:ABC transporter permease [Armatimonadota bacterium]